MLQGGLYVIYIIMCSRYRILSIERVDQYPRHPGQLYEALDERLKLETEKDSGSRLDIEDIQ